MLCQILYILEFASTVLALPVAERRQEVTKSGKPLTRMAWYDFSHSYMSTPSSTNRHIQIQCRKGITEYR
jgi:hypothetical protein